MKRIKWEYSGCRKYVKVKIGCMDLHCSVWYEYGKKSWMATAMFPGTKEMRIGALCPSLAKCKEEALKVAREMLEDHYVAVLAEMANFVMGEEVTDDR